MRFDRMIDWCKRVYLRKVVKYNDPKAYWDKRWSLRLIPGRTDYTDVFLTVQKVMEKHECKSVLEIGCGQYPLSALPGHIGLDFSTVALDGSGLRSYICADVTERIPLPDKSVDALYSGNVLLHISPEKIRRVVEEYQRVTRKCIILAEPVKQFKTQYECYWHDTDALFTGFEGEVIHIAKAVD